MSELVRETLEQVITPVIYAEALDLIEEHKRAGRKTVIISSSPIETVQAIGEHLGVDDVIATPRPPRRGRPLHRRARVLRVRSAQGRGDSRDGGARRHRPRAQLRVFGLDHRLADARARRQSRRGEPGPRARARRRATATGSGSRSSDRCACAIEYPCRRKDRRSRPGAHSQPSARAPRCTCGSAGATKSRRA